MDTVLASTLSTLPRLRELVMSGRSSYNFQSTVNIEVALHAGIRVIHIASAFDVVSLINSANRWPQTLRELILQMPPGAERAEDENLQWLRDVCRARRVVLRRKTAS